MWRKDKNNRRLGFESLESREMLSVSPLTYVPEKTDWFEQLAEPLAVGAAQTSGIVEKIVAGVILTPALFF